MSEAVQKWASILFGIGVVGLIGWMTIDQTNNPRPKKVAEASDAGALSDAAASSPPVEPNLSDASTTLLDLLLPEGGAPTTLPSGAPRQVRIGVVVVSWRGAEGATTATRSKAEALARAQQLQTDAKADFRRAVSAGDPGSSEDIGRIPRGILEPATEAAVFVLAPKDVSEVLETPKGYWIVRRND